MSSVSVRIPTILRTYTGGEAEVKAEGATLRAVVADLEASYTGIAARILDELENGASRRRVELRPDGKAPVRAHAVLDGDEGGATRLGEVTSGGFGPSVDGPVAMGYVPLSHAEPGTRVFAEVRGKFLPVTVTALPFITPTYKR